MTSVKLINHSSSTADWNKLLSSDSEINAYALLSIIKKRLNDD